MHTVFEIDAEHAELSTTLAAQGVEYVFASFVDIAGRAKSKCVPIEHLPELMAGHERYTPAWPRQPRPDDTDRGRMRRRARRRAPCASCPGTVASPT